MLLYFQFSSTVTEDDDYYSWSICEQQDICKNHHPAYKVIISAEKSYFLTFNLDNRNFLSQFLMFLQSKIFFTIRRQNGYSMAQKRPMTSKSCNINYDMCVFYYYNAVQ